MRPLIIANWKMHPSTLGQAQALAAAIGRAVQGLSGAAVAVAPPFPYLAAVGARIRPARLAAQDVFWESSGPRTGEVSPAMLRDLGVRYVILGHSERRALGESDELVARKVRAVARAGLTPVIAIGETAREAHEVVPVTIRTQLSSAVAMTPRRHLRGAVVAYEPLWAISTARGARPDTPDNATRRALYIRKLLVRLLGEPTAATVRVIYGGSVTAHNAAAFISRDIRGMEGVLVGAAGLDAREFSAIAAAVSRASRWSSRSVRS